MTVIQDDLNFYEPVDGSPLEDDYCKQLIDSKQNHALQELSFKMKSSLTLLSNLIDKADEIKLDTLKFMPRVGFEKEILLTNKFSPSLLFSTYRKDLPNRPYTFSQSK